MKKNTLLTLLTSLLFIQPSVAEISFKVDVERVRLNVNAVVKVAENCTFTGWERDERDISFFAICDGIKKSITVIEDNLLTSFVIQTTDQPESIKLEVYKSHDVDWEKINKALLKNNARERHE
jgi:hypothetical protein